MKDNPFYVWLKMMESAIRFGNELFERFSSASSIRRS